MRIFIPTSNGYTKACEWTCRLIDKYWTDHPAVDIVHFENRPSVPPGFNTMSLGHQIRCQKWTDHFLAYLHRQTDEFFILMLDDYGLFQPVNEHAIKSSVDLMRNDIKVCSVAMTWQPTHKEPYGDTKEFVVFPAWKWSVNTQASVWRRESLLRICTESRETCGNSPWHTEQVWSHFFDYTMRPEGFVLAGWNCREPSNPSKFVDSTDKTDWPIAYNNLYHTGKLDERHREFLQSEGLL